MKFLHTSDLHLDSPLTARLGSDKIRQRKRELLSSFRRSVELALRNSVAGVIISGDLFDSERISRSTLESVISLISHTPSVSFFYLFGNHEKDALMESGLPLPKNLFLFGDGWTYYEFGEAVVVGRCTTSADMFETLTLDASKKNIVVLHGELADRSDEDGKIGRRELEDLPIDYLALGHYHTYSAVEISRRTTAVYPGTPEGRGFDEVGDKGVVLLEVDSYGITHTFVKTSERALRIVKVDISSIRSAYELENVIENATRGIDNTDIVRVVLVGERELTRTFDTDAVRDRFIHKFYFFECRDESRVRISADDFKNDKTLKGEFIRGVISDTRLSDEQKEKVITTGLRALLGEDVD